MKGGLGQLMKQAQKLQEDLQQAQNELASMEVVGEAGAGMVTVTMTGRHDVRSVRIDSALMGEDKEMLEDLIAAAGERCGSQGRGPDEGSIRRTGVRAQSSVRHEAAVLARISHQVASEGVEMAGLARRTRVRARRRTRQYVEHPGRVQRSQCSQIRVRSRDLVRNAG